ncbi:hypothetical protein [Vibrio furnissii]|uniref:hypothetical protein n=1 Tax=Vibrio furnissii TaxID=29494 RepID=UPI003AA969ED
MPYLCVAPVLSALFSGRSERRSWKSASIAFDPNDFVNERLCASRSAEMRPVKLCRRFEACVKGALAGIGFALIPEMGRAELGRLAGRIPPGMPSIKSCTGITGNESGILKRLSRDIITLRRVFCRGQRV